MPRVMIVEDDPEMGRLIARSLEADGHESVVVDNGVDALIALAAGDFALAAVDVMLPQMSGFEICRRIRQTGSTIPVLLITARDAIEDRVFGLDSGADDYLTKPFAFAELSARVRALLRREAAVERTILTAGTLRLDAINQSTTVAGHPLALSPKEFGLLRLLAAHPGETVARSAILEDVWGTTENIDHNIVDQYVSYLRRKIDPTRARVQIATVRGAGYRLEEIG